MRVIIFYLSAVALKFLIVWPVCFLLAPFISLFTDDNKWGAFKWFGTYDNNPIGDEGWISKRCPFPYEVDGWKGWVNRTGWLWRNPCYGYNRDLGVYDDEISIVKVSGNPDITDRHRISGYYFVRAYDDFSYLSGFEFYIVAPYKLGKLERCLRARIGWKLNSKTLARRGFAPLVFTVNPIKKYG